MKLPFQEWQKLHPKKSVHDYYADDSNQTNESNMFDNQLDVIEAAKQCIANNQIKEAIGLVRSQYANNESFYNYLTTVESRYNKNEKLFNLGVLESEKYVLNNSKVGYSILQALDRLGKGVHYNFEEVDSDLFDQQNIHHRISIKINTLNKEWENRSFFNKLTSPLIPNVLLGIGIFYGVSIIVNIFLFNSMTSSFDSFPASSDQFDPFENFNNSIDDDFQRMTNQFSGVALFLGVFVSALFVLASVHLRQMVQKNIAEERILKAKIGKLLEQLS